MGSAVKVKHQLQKGKKYNTSVNLCTANSLSFKTVPYFFCL